jgi:hypothetical protein
MRRHLRRLLTPISKQVPNLRAAAQLLSQSRQHGLKLLIQSQTFRGPKTDPDLYSFAAFLAELFGCTNIIIIGAPAAHELVCLLPRFQITGIVDAAQVDSGRKKFPMINWIAGQMDSDIVLAEGTLRRSLIICARVIDGLPNPSPLLRNIKAWLDHAPLCLLTTHDRDTVEMQCLLDDQGIDPAFIGLTTNDNVSWKKNTVLTVLQNNSLAKPGHTVTPTDFRVVAFMAAYNEEDIIVESIRKWTDQGVRVHVLENWSTDATYDLIRQAAQHAPVTVERFPREGPSPHFEWAAMLARIEELTRETEADWFVRRGADEILVSPWPGLSYRDGLYLVDRAGFNCVDHTILEFYPVDDGFTAGMDHEAYFKHFDFKRLSHHWQRKAWKNSGVNASSIATAGHDMVFEGRRIYPFKFLLKHYSFRSQKHGEQKVFRDRKPRWNWQERARGWHIHYDSIKQGHRFVQSPSDKESFDEDSFHKKYLVERLSGIGVDR